MTRVVTGSRLHFGLFHVPVDGLTHWPDGTPVRKFGGVGMMLEGPEIAVSVEASTTGEATGPLAERALGFARRVADRGVSLRVTVERCPPEHVGLGVGTQLGLAVGAAVVGELGKALDFPGIAKLVGRGERSGIGVHGFASGGFLVDGGKVEGAGIAAPVCRLDWPAGWPIVLARPRVTVGCHGDRERAAFARSRTSDSAIRTTEKLCRLALLGLVPALRDRDFPGFSTAILEFNRTAGEPFAADQGGVYASPESDVLIRLIRDFGIAGAGQSSWGPTVFAICSDPDQAHFLAGKLRDSAEVTVTRGKNCGATHSRT